MIFVNSEKDAVTAYIMEGLRRLWSVSVDENGESVSFDYFYNHSPRIDGRVNVPYNDVYCSIEEQQNIINDLVKEPYCTPSGKIHKLKKFNVDTIKYNTTLGPSPFSSKERFIERHPKFKKVEKKFK